MVCYFSAVDLSDGDYKLSLTDFETYHMISNVNSLNNKFFFDKEIVIAEGSYEIRDINKYLKYAILQFYPNDVAREKTFRKEDEQYSLTIHEIANKNAMKSENALIE